MTALTTLLNTYRQAAQSEREKGTYFEDLICTYLRNEASYRDLYSDVWTYAQWADLEQLDKRDTGIDLVAKTQGTGEFHAIQCKFMAQDYRVQKADIDSFFTASGKKPFTHRLIITTTNNWSEHAEDALQNQQPPVTKIDLTDLENSQIDWSQYQPRQAAVLRPKKALREHQQLALNATAEGLQNADRGKLIMACGTGKTFTSLKIAETLFGPGKRILFLVPSLSLLSQSLTEWTQESQTPLHSFAVCSDSDVGKKRKADDDIVQTFTHELRYPATTEPRRLAQEMEKRHDAHHMSVVFSTYHSIDTISRAQHEFGLANFDLIVCDEAHRTTGAAFEDEEESHFIRVHDAAYIRASKRIYMTATPRIYADIAKANAEKDNVALCSMDDATLFGEELYCITFSEAVRRELLVDYKVIVLAVDQAHVSQRLQRLLADDNNQLKVDDAAKIVGCWKALNKLDTRDDLVDDREPMRRAVAFCQVIEVPVNAKTHKVASKNIADMFQAVVEAYQEQEATEGLLQCEAAHVDGSMNASQKEAKLNWLKEETPENTCRVLSNVRCLSEGVDVPALDAVLFLTPRNSQVDVVQSVGRVMRKAEGKKRGYVILPVVIPFGIEPHEALNDNKTYKVVWQVLQALRSHDDRFDAMINKLDLIGSDRSKMEVIAITDKYNKNRAETRQDKPTAKGQFAFGQPDESNQVRQNRAENSFGEQTALEFDIGEIERAIYAKVVQKCGNRSHWEDWANDIAKIARTHIARITTIIETPENTEEIAAFSAFAAEIRDDLNNKVSDSDIVEMLAQHLITKPVFDALFEGYSFAQNNPMSRALQGVLDTLQKHNLGKEADTLQRFYESVKERASGINNAAAKQKIIVELYDKFFKNAFPRMAEKLGIVYTPLEVVDFIIHSVNVILQTEFKTDLGNKGVHIIDPFTGTGTFITRLLQSGLISKENLAYKYKHEIHANEIVLLAYYIAAINIESVYHGLAGGDYLPFDGICLTDTFQMYEKDDLVSALLVDNSARRKRQKELDIRVIIGNPPYSAGQNSANDNNANVPYPKLDESIRSSYAALSTATNKNALYDSYIRAIRWASDRLGESGVIGFITNAGFVDANTADGLRKCLAKEFCSIYVFHLRGNQRTSGELSRREGGKIFRSGSRAPIAITIMVKNLERKDRSQIRFYDIGDYLTTDEKLQKIAEIGSIAGITAENNWLDIEPDEHGDWLRKRDNSFSDFISLGSKNSNSKSIFKNYSMGIKTNRDAWVYQFSLSTLKNNMHATIDFFNKESCRYQTYTDKGSKEKSIPVENFIDQNPKLISWSRALRSDIAKFKNHSYKESAITVGLYRPFTKQHLYFDRSFINDIAQTQKFFPNDKTENLVICIAGLGTPKDFSALISPYIPDLQTIANGQCFPLKLFHSNDMLAKHMECNHDLFDIQERLEDATNEYRTDDGISDEGLKYFINAYTTESIAKEDLFYYVYGLLHSDDYRNRYADNLSKELPRIPRVRKAADFWAFSKAGRKLADLHLNYETAEPYPVKYEGGALLMAGFSAADYYVTQMKFGKKGKDKDKSKVIYNHKITMTDIPLEAYEYVVNGKPALEWVMERQAVTTHKESGIVNDANLWATETMNNPAYPLELFQRVITVSLETMKIVRALPRLDIL